MGNVLTDANGVIKGLMKQQIDTFILRIEVIHMTNQLKEILNELSKDQLIYLIEQYYYSQFLISEICVDESKQHISSENSIQKIRSYLYNLPKTYNVTDFKALIDMKMGKITVDEYRKILGLD